MKVIRFSIILVIVLCGASAFGQTVWVAGTPSAASTRPNSVTLNYGINKPGKVYIAVYNSDLSPLPSSAAIKTYAAEGPSGGRVATAVLPVTATYINMVLSTVLEGMIANTLHSIFLVAEDNAGVLQPSPVKLLFTTLQCPQINVLTDLTQPQQCVNLGATAVFQIMVNPDPMVSGILKGTIWTLEWGDGMITNYTSATDSDLPPPALVQHTYTTMTDCNYLLSCRIQNPCGNNIDIKYVAVVHGRDIPSDGDGMLRIVNNSDGSDNIQVCEGTQTTITVRDNSTWNCQNPVLPTGFTPVPNNDPRNIEWLYGRDPQGVITNTITGSVTVSTLGVAPQSSGRISPSLNGPGSLAQAVTIPATCRAGEYFRIYLKNWNKCNWQDPEYVSAYIDILVIAAPPAPVVADKTVCQGSDRTLTVTSTPVGSIKWYSDPALTVLIAAGTTYVPVQNLPGVYTYWVVDQSLTGQMCNSPATKATLTILPSITNNAVGTAHSLCHGAVPAPLNGTVPTGGTGSYTYLWQHSVTSPVTGFVPAAGVNNQQNYNSAGPLNQTTWFRRLVTSGNCTNISSTVRIIIYPPLTSGTIGFNQVICANSLPSMLIQTSASTGGTGTYNYQWQKSNDGVVWNDIPAAVSQTYQPAILVTSTYFRQRVISGGCVPVFSPVIKITIKPIPDTPVISKTDNVLSSNIAAGNQWYYQSNPIQGATGQTYTVTEKGNYHVVVTVNGCVSQPSNVINVSSLTGIEDINSVRTFEVYPNPNQGNMIIKIESFRRDIFNLIIMNKNGVILWKKEGILVTDAFITPVHVQDFQPGTYIVVLSNKISSIKKKIIITR